MVKKASFLIILISLIGCKTEVINQTIDKKKEGKWVELYDDGNKYKSVEYYKHDQPVKKWKSYIDGKIYKTEKYKNGICIVKYYHKNGKLQSKGQTRIETDSVKTHWYYSGDWKFYSDNGKLTEIRKYNNGELLAEQKNN
jgi:antitoxin component YwqK of YwqJK toxin-antitoxin module